jgi:hypothetical protein
MASITVSLQVTGKSVGSGFYGNVLIGDPPPAPTAPAATLAPASLRATTSPFDQWAPQLGATIQTGTTDFSAKGAVASPFLDTFAAAAGHAKLFA